MKEKFVQLLDEHLEVFSNLDEVLKSLEKATHEIIKVLHNGNKILICGNGGSAADSQHFAAELVGRFEVNHRKSLPAIALSTDTSSITAIGNDFGYKDIFKRQVDALCSKGDVLVMFSTSGKSQNILAAAESANEIGASCIMFTGQSVSEMLVGSSIEINAPSCTTARIQEFHIFCIHCICSEIDREFS